MGKEVNKSVEVEIFVQDFCERGMFESVCLHDKLRWSIDWHVHKRPKIFQISI